jgi:hypothetical protein
VVVKVENIMLLLLQEVLEVEKPTVLLVQ